uniref:Lipocalin n=1 Tax=Rhipicephalus appendiculatus TaxID=34631 RepID=A0A131YRM8_RHIAP
MKVYFAFLPAYAFVLLHISPSTRSDRGTHPILPANNSVTLYLVGYSNTSYNPLIKCVKSEYTFDRTGITFKRYLILHLLNESTKQWKSTGFTLFVDTADDPIVFSINITGVAEDWKKHFHVRNSYKVFHYDNETMVLGEGCPGVSYGAPCSLWVTGQYADLKKKLPELTNISFRTNCENATFAPYGEDCWG